VECRESPPWRGRGGGKGFLREGEGTPVTTGEERGRVDVSGKKKSKGVKGEDILIHRSVGSRKIGIGNPYR